MACQPLLGHLMLELIFFFYKQLDGSVLLFLFNNYQTIISSSNYFKYK